MSRADINSSVHGLTLAETLVEAEVPGDTLPEVDDGTLIETLGEMEAETLAGTLVEV